jgi:pantoate--beta-alanine ligase
MDRITTVDAMQRFADRTRSSGETIALVPTMGALHAGHLALVREAVDRADRVVVSIFVNPTQFGPDEDYEAYPRDLDDDEARLRELGVDAVFAPSVEEMYPNAGGFFDDPITWVTVDRLTDHLCGAYRDGHFRGVTTVVAKLLNACKPHVAVFGTKDAQQLVIIRRMVEDLLMDVDIVGVETVRDPDGLAASSRNAYLNDDERRQARVLSEAVEAAKARIFGGEQEAEPVVEAMQQALAAAPDGEVQYAEVVDARTLQPVDSIAPGTEVIAAVAVFFGDTRLIDNAFISVPTRD